jgi:alkaline phosphatase D
MSSGGDGEDRRFGSDYILASNPQLKFVNSQRGYHVHEVGREAWVTDVMVMDQVRERGGQISRRARLTAPHGRPDLTVA